MSQSRKPSRHPTASKYRSRAKKYVRPVGMMGGGQGGVMGGPASAGLW